MPRYAVDTGTKSCDYFGLFLPWYIELEEDGLWYAYNKNYERISAGFEIEGRLPKKKAFVELIEKCDYPKEKKYYVNTKRKKYYFYHKGNIWDDIAKKYDKEYFERLRIFSKVNLHFVDRRKQ